MLRFLTERRLWAAAALVVLALVLGLWVWGVPRAIASASGMIGERLGVDASIESSELSFGSVALRGLELRGRHGGILVRIDEVDADMSFVAALFKGAGAVRRVSARGVDVHVALQDEGFADSLSVVREKLSGRATGSGSSARPRGKGRTYEVSGLSLRVSDRGGPLVVSNDASLHKEGDAVRAQALETLLGERSGDYAFIGASSIELRRNDEGAWQLHQLGIERGDVRSLRNGDADKRALAIRVRDALRKLRGEEEEPPPADDFEAPAPDAAVEDAAVEDAAIEDASVELAPPTPPGPGPSQRLFARLSPDAQIEVRDVDIESRTSEDGRIERIRGFELGVEGGSNGWYRVTLGGETSNKGTIHADLSLKPSEARAEGSIKLRRISLALIAPFVPQLPLYEPELGTLNAQLELDADSPDRVTIDGGFQINELALFSERIANDPIENINVSVRGKGAWLPVERRLEIAAARIRMNEAQALIEGELERTTEHYRVDLTTKLPPTDCNEVVGAIPADVLGSLRRFEWSGNWAALGRIVLDSRELEATELSIKVRNLCLFEKTPRWVAIERFQEPFRHRVVEPDETVFEMITGPETDNWVAFEDISPFMVPAVISHEDGGFYDHGGFAPWAIRDALVRNLQEGRYVVGASTISMQLAKNLYLQREKTIARKVQEVILTWWLENALTKDEILELYLNVIEYGPSVYGLRHAAAFYFGREPSELSPAEAAYLACMLPSPKRYIVSYERDALTRSMKNRMRRLLEHMAKRERIGPEALAYGLAELENFQFQQDGDMPPAPRFLPPLGAPGRTRPQRARPLRSPFRGALSLPISGAPIGVGVNTDLAPNLPLNGGHRGASEGLCRGCLALVVLCESRAQSLFSFSRHPRSRRSPTPRSSSSRPVTT